MNKTQLSGFSAKEAKPQWPGEVKAGKAPCGGAGFAQVLGAQAEEMGEGQEAERSDSQGTGKRKSNWVPAPGSKTER